MINLNSLFPWMSIRTKLIIAFVGLSLLPLLVVGVYAVQMKVNMMEENALQNLTHDVHVIRGRSSAFLLSVESDVRFLRSDPLVNAFLSHPSVAQPPIQLSQELLAFVRERRVYNQIRLIGPDGTELLRVEPVDLHDAPVEYRFAPAERLRTGNEAWSFNIAERAGEGQIAFAPAELSAPEGGTIPVFSFVTPIDGPAGRCLLIANVYAGAFFDVVQMNPHFGNEATIAIVNSEGRYLYHSVKKADWNKLLASRDEDVLQSDYPPSIAGAIISGTEGTESAGIDAIVSHALIFDLPSAYTNSFFVIESIPKSFLLKPVYASATVLGAMLLLFLCVSAALAVVATRQFTKPVAELYRGAGIIARGGYSHRLDIRTHDEIEALAGHFNLMAAALEEHERETHDRRTTLEEMVTQRTHELSEEKAKLQGILDNVPSAIVLLDSSFHILSASAAFEQVTDLRISDVRGVDCRQVFCEGEMCTACVCIRVAETGEPATHVDHVVTRTGQERYLEHTAIPMRENGKITRFLEIITDVTRRRQFEERAIRTERLLAVGETAAFVAHQMRNGLTSIKMLVQLRRESPVVPEAERRSLDIVLGSITHLEQVVTDLLAFARPGPIVPTPASLNVLATEAAAFVRPQFSAAAVSLKMSLDSDLPRVLLDTTLVREAIIALLLNGVQAIGAEGTITVRTVFDEKMVRISVEDTGTGINPAVLEHLFEPFFTTKPTGNGLGLAMARRIVESHGGTTEARNAEAGGALFTFVFPISVKTNNESSVPLMRTT